MSALGQLRDRLEKIHDMMPLSPREEKLAHWVVFGDGECELSEEGEAWWGPKAWSVLKHFEAV